MDGLHRPIVAAPLGIGQPDLEIAVEVALIEIEAVAGGRHRLESEIDTDILGAVGNCGLFDFADKVAIPAPAGVLTEGSGLDLVREVAVLPETKLFPAQKYQRAFDLDVLVGERDPAQRPTRTAADAPAQLGFPRRGAALDVFEDDVLHDLRGQSDQLAAALGQAEQLALGDPLGSLRSVPADVVAVIPDEVDLPAQRGEFLAAGGILDAETEGFIELGLFLWLALFVKFLHTSKLGTNREPVNWSVTSMVNTWWTTKPAPPRVGAVKPGPERRGFTAEDDKIA